MEPVDNRAREQYLQQDRSVNIRDTLEKQKKLDDGKLNDIDIRKTVKSLGKEDFLQLLVTQLTHQDPTKPQTDQDFIAQMAQFSSLEQMQNVSHNLGKLSERQSANLVGKFIIGKDFVTGQEVTGVAAAIFYDGSGEGFVKVRGRTVNLNDISLIGDPTQFKKEYGGYGPEADQSSQPSSRTNGPAVQNPNPGPQPRDAENGPLKTEDMFEQSPELRRDSEVKPGADVSPQSQTKENPSPTVQSIGPANETIAPTVNQSQDSEPASEHTQPAVETKGTSEINPGAESNPSHPGKSDAEQKATPSDKEFPAQSYLNHLYNDNKEEARLTLAV